MLRTAGKVKHRRRRGDPASTLSRKRFREVNERIDALAQGFALQGELTILCECASDQCSERITIAEAEYKSLRRIPTHFAVLPGHEIPTVERIVEKNNRYIVVEKFGEGAIAAIKLDPRRRA